MKLKKQRGFIHITGWDVASICIVCGIVGWAAIEGLLWVWRHLSFGWLS